MQCAFCERIQVKNVITISSVVNTPADYSVMNAIKHIQHMLHNTLHTQCNVVHSCDY